MKSLTIFTYVFQRSFFLLLVFFFWSCQSNDSQTQPEAENNDTVASITFTPEQVKNASISTQSPVLKEISATLEVVGVIELPANRKIDIRVPLSGKVVYIDLLPGMMIKKGQVLVTLSDIQYLELKKTFLLAQSTYELEKINFAKQQDLWASRAIPEREYLASKATFEKSTIELQATKASLEALGISTPLQLESDLTSEISLRSPIDGYVGSVETSLGDYVQPEKTIVRLLDLSDMHLTMKFLESDLGKLEEELPFTAKTQAYPKKEYKGSIHIIGKEFDDTNMVEVHAHFDSFYPELIPGMVMSTKVYTKKNMVLTLPEEAINQFGEHLYVFETTNGTTFSPAKVITGLSENGFTEIISGIHPDKQYVIKGAYSVLMQWKNVSEE